MTEEDIIKLAEVLRIKIDGNEKELVFDILEFLSYAKKLNNLSELDLKDDEDIIAEKLINIFRKDEKRKIDIDEANEIVSAFPEKSERLLKVRPIFDENEDFQE